MKGYKGFNKDLKCRDFQYEIGKTYETDEAKLCESGFHFCEAPLDVFNYYVPADSRFCEIEAEDISNEKDSDSKRVAKKLKIGAEIGIPGLVKAQIEYVKANLDGKKPAATNTGDRSAATNTGNRSAASVSGKNSVAMNIGVNGKTKGALGCYLVLAEWVEIDDMLNLKAVKAHKVDGKTVKPDVWYKLVDGKFTEAE